MSTKKNDQYAGFEYPITEVSAFLQGVDIFSISLKNGNVARFKPADNNSFRQWLVENNIRDIAEKEVL